MDESFWYDQDGCIRSGLDGMRVADLVCWTDLLYQHKSPATAAVEWHRLGRLLASSARMYKLLQTVTEKYETDEDSVIKELLSYIDVERGPRPACK